MNVWAEGRLLLGLFCWDPCESADLGVCSSFPYQGPENAGFSFQTAKQCGYRFQKRRDTSMAWPQSAGRRTGSLQATMTWIEKAGDFAPTNRCGFFVLDQSVFLSGATWFLFLTASLCLQA